MCCKLLASSWQAPQKARSFRFLCVIFDDKFIFEQHILDLHTVLGISPEKFFKITWFCLKITFYAILLQARKGPLTRSWVHWNCKKLTIPSLKVRGNTLLKDIFKKLQPFFGCFCFSTLPFCKNFAIQAVHWLKFNIFRHIGCVYFRSS